MAASRRPLMCACLPRPLTPAQASCSRPSTPRSRVCYPQISFLPTVVGLLIIPAVIFPLDILAHWTMNSSYRRIGGKMLGVKGE